MSNTNTHLVWSLIPSKLIKVSSFQFYKIKKNIEIVQIDLQILNDSKLSPFLIDLAPYSVCIRVPLYSHLKSERSLLPQCRTIFCVTIDFHCRSFIFIVLRNIDTNHPPRVRPVIRGFVSLVYPRDQELRTRAVTGKIYLLGPHVFGNYTTFIDLWFLWVILPYNAAITLIFHHRANANPSHFWAGALRSKISGIQYPIRTGYIPVVVFKTCLFHWFLLF